VVISLYRLNEYHTFTRTEPFWFRNITIDGEVNGKKWPTFDTDKYEFVYINSSTPSIKENPYVNEYGFFNSSPLFSGLNEDEESVEN